MGPPTETVSGSAVVVANVESVTVCSLLCETVSALFAVEVSGEELAVVDVDVTVDRPGAVVDVLDVAVEGSPELVDCCVVTPRVELVDCCVVTGATLTVTASTPVVVLEATVLVVIDSDGWDAEHAGEKTKAARVNRNK